MGAARIEILLKPRARSNRIGILDKGIFGIAVTAPPVDDRANGQMVEVLAERLNVPKREIAIIKGRHGRNKVVAVEGLTKEEVMKKLQVAS